VQYHPADGPSALVPPDMFVGYATAIGRVSYPGSMEECSYYTDGILKNIRRKVPVERLFDHIHRIVRYKTCMRQCPVYHNRLHNFYLNGL